MMTADTEYSLEVIKDMTADTKYSLEMVNAMTADTNRGSMTMKRLNTSRLNK